VLFFFVVSPLLILISESESRRLLVATSWCYLDTSWLRMNEWMDDGLGTSLASANCDKPYHYTLGDPRDTPPHRCISAQKIAGIYADSVVAAIANVSCLPYRSECEL